MLIDCLIKNVTITNVTYFSIQNSCAYHENAHQHVNSLIKVCKKIITSYFFEEQNGSDYYRYKSNDLFIHTTGLS